MSALDLSRQIQIFASTLSSEEPNHILLFNTNAVTAEIAKNLVLCRAGQVTIVDDECVMPRDYEAVPFLRADAQDNHTFARSIVKYCKEASPNAPIQAITEADAADLLEKGKVQVAVFTNQSVSKLRTYNETCRKCGVKFIAVSSNGMACSIFNDFLDVRSFADRSGSYAQDECTKEIKEIICERDCVRVSLNQKNRLNQIRKGDSIYFTTSSVGANSKNCPKYEVLAVDFAESTLLATVKDPAGIVTSKFVKKAPRNISLQFRSLADFSDNPPLNCQEDCALAYLVYIALLTDESVALDVEEWVTKSRLLHQQMTLEANYDVKFDENIVRKIILYWDYALPPVVSLVSALAANEVMKACSGWYRPIHQLACFASDPQIVDPHHKISPMLLSDHSPNCLQRAIIGEIAQERLSNFQVLLVGAGALGSELAKLLLAMGIGFGPQGHIHVVDFDQIEPSNLHRQFWFKEQDRGLFKSEVVVREIKKIEPMINCTAYTHKLDKSKTPFSDKFFEKVDVIIGAVDSFEARKYLCELAQTYNKLFLEAGTGAMIGSSSFFIHGKTELYTYAAPQQTLQLAASCTAKSVPSQFRHCMQWATNRFQETFSEQLSVYKHYLKDSTSTHPNYATMISHFSSFFHEHDTKTLVQFIFDSWFTTKILDLPVKNQAAGTLSLSNDLHQQFVNKFCSVLAERPINDLPTQFDKDNILHLELISITARIYAEIFGTDTITDSIEDLYLVQIMAANISPAIITTTAAMASLCALQLYKLAADLPASTYEFFDCNFATNYIGVARMNERMPIEYPYIELDPIPGSATVEEFAQLFTNHLKSDEEIIEIEIRTSRGLRLFDPTDKQRIGELFASEPNKFKYILASVSLMIEGQKEQIRVKAPLLRDKPTKRWFFF